MTTAFIAEPPGRAETVSRPLTGSIGRDLNAAGRRTLPSKSRPEGVPFRPTTRRRILLSPCYAALLLLLLLLLLLPPEGG